MPEEMPAICPEGRGRNPREHGTGASKATAMEGNSCPGPCLLMEAVLERGNMRVAYERVVANKGSAGVDGMTVDQLDGYVRENWPSIKAALLSGTYQPQPVRRVEIPKPGGGERTLGIPTVLDRLIQQALHQVLSPIFEEGFSDHSYGFRPGRSTHDAVRQAQRYVSEGRRYVVDMDLEKFFDRVNHDIAGKSAVARPWERKFLGYSMTWHKRPRLKVAEASVKRLKGDLRAS